MNVKVNDPPRQFTVGNYEPIVLSDCGRIELEPDELVVFTTTDGAEYDVGRKSWGFYATPSLNGRLARFGLRAVLAKNPQDRFFVLLVEQGKEDDFHQYMQDEQMEIVIWLDSTDVLNHLEQQLKQ